MAAAFFGTLASQSQAAGESISINFGTNEPNGTISDSSSAGLEAVPGSNWNQFSGASQSTAQNLKDTPPERPSPGPVKIPGAEATPPPPGTARC